MTLQADKKQEQEPSVPCPRCGYALQSGMVKTAIWRAERLVVVENIPAQVCNGCTEQYYDDATTDALRRLTTEDFASAKPTREVVVPIYSLKERILRPKPPSDDDDDFEFDY
jgi:YgiT-type zinc finger domain-containing protein